jgi:hypothetical protein
MTKFKVGDKVKCVDEKEHPQLNVGKEYTVKETVKEKFVRLEELKGQHSCYNACFELVKATVKPVKFKVGDRVNHCSLDGTLSADAEGTIIRIEGMRIFSDFDSCDNEVDYPAEYLVLVKPAPERTDDEIADLLGLNGPKSCSNTMESAEELNNFYSPSLTTLMSKEDTMKLTFATIETVNDRNIALYSAAEQGQLIQDADAAIAKLEAYSVKTKAIIREIKELKAGLKQAVVLFDSLED